MAKLAFLVSLVALGVAVLAYREAVAPRDVTQEMTRRLETLRQETADGLARLRQETADMLSRGEKALRAPEPPKPKP
jgi:hypothetical protein